MLSRTFFLAATLTIWLPGHVALATICSDGRFLGSVSSSCYEHFYGNDDCTADDGTRECTRLEISLRTVDEMIRNTNDQRLLDFLLLWKEKATSENPNAGMVLPFVDVDQGPQFLCSVYLRKGILNEMGSVLYTFRSRSACYNVGRDAFVNFFNTLRDRSAFVSPYDKLLFANYPIEEIRSHYEAAVIDPAHRAFVSLIQSDQVTTNVPDYEVHRLPAVTYFNDEHRSLKEVAFEIGFEDENAWQAIWSMNYDKVHDPKEVREGVSLAIPGVPRAEENWVGPFSMQHYEDSHDLAVKLYGNEEAQGIVHRIIRTTRAFGMTDMFFPDDLGEDWLAEPVFFFKE